MATREEIIQAATEAHSESNKDNGGTHAILIYGDGEICFTKGGDLFGMRSLHQWYSPKFTDGTYYEFPYDMCGCYCAIVKDLETAIRIREMM